MIQKDERPTLSYAGLFSGWLERAHTPALQLKHFIRDSSSEAEEKGIKCMYGSGSHILLRGVSNAAHCYTEIEPWASYITYTVQWLVDGYGGLAERKRKSAVGVFVSTCKLSTSH